MTCHCVNTAVTLGWVRAPNDLAPFSVHDAVASFAIQDSESRRFDLNISLSVSQDYDLAPTSAQDLLFSLRFNQTLDFFKNIDTHSERF